VSLPKLLATLETVAPLAHVRARRIATLAILALPRPPQMFAPLPLPGTTYSQTRLGSQLDLEPSIHAHIVRHGHIAKARTPGRLDG
jgi:hypothetical protein